MHLLPLHNDRVGHEDKFPLDREAYHADCRANFPDFRPHFPPLQEGQARTPGDQEALLVHVPRHPAEEQILVDLHDDFLRSKADASQCIFVAGRERVLACHHV